MWNRIGMGIVAVVVLLPIGCFVPVTRERHTCVICRLMRVDSRYGPVPLSRLYETDCSLWYAAHVEPNHAHVWEGSTCVYETDLFGIPSSVGCSPGHYPIWGLSPNTQMLAYQHFKNPLEAKAIFADLTDAKTYNDRLEEDFRSKGHHVVQALQEWEAAGFPGTWSGWWTRYYARHVAEHNEWLVWLKSDSGLNFDDWRKQRPGPTPTR